MAFLEYSNLIIEILVVNNSSQLQVFWYLLFLIAIFNFVVQTVTFLKKQNLVHKWCHQFFSWEQINGIRCKISFIVFITFEKIRPLYIRPPFLVKFSFKFLSLLTVSMVLFIPAILYRLIIFRKSHLLIFFYRFY